MVALILCYTGLRPTELALIKTADVDLAARCMKGGIGRRLLHARKQIFINRGRCAALERAEPSHKDFGSQRARYFFADF